MPCVQTENIMLYYSIYSSSISIGYTYTSILKKINFANWIILINKIILIKNVTFDLFLNVIMTSMQHFYTPINHTDGGTFCMGTAHSKYMFIFLVLVVY